MVATKTLYDTKAARELVHGILDLYGYLGKPNHQVDLHKLEKFFSPNIEIISNDKKVVRNISQFQERIRNIQKRFPIIAYTKPLEDPIIADNRVIIRYNAELSEEKGQKRLVTIIAILTVESDKVTQWTEVIHQKKI
jgi:hypothetical protein